MEEVPIQPQPPRHHSPVRLVIIMGILAMVLVSTGKAGQEFTHRWPAPIPIAAFETPAEIPDASLVESTISPLEIEVQAAAPVEYSLHVPTPIPVHGIYLTGYSAGNKKTMERIYSLIEETNINAVIIDIKDATGKLSYQPLDPALSATGVGTNRIRDLATLIADLHERNIYVIGRISVFQDPYYVNLHPEDAFLDTRTGGIWRDYKGISWLRPDRQAVWDYLVSIAKDAHVQGFDEINVDYVRFPSDGPLAYLDYKVSSQARAAAIESFFAYIDTELRGSGIVLSADLFGLTMSAHDDLGIGQKLELIAPHVDYVCPMVYPSHFASGAYNIAIPAAHPGEIIHESLSRGIAKLEAVGIGKEKLRPWLQDFNLGATYTEELVKAQISASEALGLTSWMMWDPRNWYTKGALQQ